MNSIKKSIASAFLITALLGGEIKAASTATSSNTTQNTMLIITAVVLAGALFYNVHTSHKDEIITNQIDTLTEKYREIFALYNEVSTKNETTQNSSLRNHILQINPADNTLKVYIEQLQLDILDVSKFSPFYRNARTKKAEFLTQLQALEKVLIKLNAYAELQILINFCEEKYSKAFALLNYEGQFPELSVPVLLKKIIIANNNNTLPFIDYYKVIGTLLENIEEFIELLPTDKGDKFYEPVVLRAKGLTKKLTRLQNMIVTNIDYKVEEQIQKQQELEKRIAFLEKNPVVHHSHAVVIS